MALGKGSHQKGLRRAALLLGDLPQALQGSLASRKKKKRPPNHRRCHVCLSFFEEPCLAGEPFIRETNKDGRRAIGFQPPPKRQRVSLASACSLVGDLCDQSLDLSLQFRHGLPAPLFGLQPPKMGPESPVVRWDPGTPQIKCRVVRWLPFTTT